MSNLYHEFLSDLKFQGCVEGTQERYLACLRDFMRFTDAPIREVGRHEVRTYLRHLLEHEKVGPANYKMHLAAVKYLFKVTLDCPAVVAGIPWPKVPRTLPDILSGDEVQRLLDAIEAPIHRTLVATLYSAGLRISEACWLRGSHSRSSSSSSVMPRSEPPCSTCKSA